MNTQAFEQFDIMDDEVLSVVEGGVLLDVYLEQQA